MRKARAALLGRAVPEEIAELLHRAYEDWRAGSVDGFVSLLDPNVYWRRARLLVVAQGSVLKQS